MRFGIAVFLILFMGIFFFFGCTESPGDVNEGQKGPQAQASGEEPILTVLNPLGTPPPIKLKEMAPRLDTIKGKTIYIVNDGYPGSGILLGELTAVMKEKYSETTFIYKDKPGGMGREDEDLWKEMNEKADAMIIALGH